VTIVPNISEMGRAGFRSGKSVDLRAELARPIDSVIVKLAARCNLVCDYCYWFRDPAVLDQPKRMTQDTIELVCRSIGEHLKEHHPPEFTVVLHGGEPLLLGKASFWNLCKRLQEAAAGTSSRLRLALTSNGVLIDEDWALIFAHFGIGVTLSIDGPPEVHDRHRVDLRGRPTYDRVIAGLTALRNIGLEPGVLSVLDPSVDSCELLDHMVRVLGLTEIDFLIPDAIHGDLPISVAPILIGLFDHWWERYAAIGVRIRLFDAVISGLLGGSSGVESIGFGPVRAATISSSGMVEAHDVCRITGMVHSGIDLRKNALDSIRGDMAWRSILMSSLTLANECERCEWRDVCGGGHIASRWSSLRGFDNPSVYCADLKQFLSHVWARVRSDLVLKVGEAVNAGDTI